MKSRLLKCVFVLDPLDKLFWSEDTSCTVMQEACRRGHTVLGLQLGNVFVENCSICAQVEKLRVSLKSGIVVLEQLCTFKLQDADIIFIRKEPPFDSEYLYLTQMLGLLSERTFILNSPNGLRETNEKLAILDFPTFIPPTLVSAKAEKIKLFAENLGEKIIVKPLDQKGGAGIQRLDPKDSDFDSKVKELTRDGARTVMVQKYVSDVEQKGDVRVLLLGGEILGYFSRVPLPGKFIANMDQGGRAVRHKLTAHEKKISLTVGKKLLEKGHHFVGLDIIGEQLTEINVTSPAGAFEVDQLEGANTASAVVDYLEKQARRRHR